MEKESMFANPTTLTSLHFTTSLMSKKNKKYFNRQKQTCYIIQCQSDMTFITLHHELYPGSTISTTESRMIRNAFSVSVKWTSFFQVGLLFSSVAYWIIPAAANISMLSLICSLVRMAFEISEGSASALFNKPLITGSFKMA